MGSANEKMNSGLSSRESWTRREDLVLTVDKLLNQVLETTQISACIPDDMENRNVLIPVHCLQSSMSTAVGNSFHVPSLMAMCMMLVHLLMLAVARPLSSAQEKQFHTRLKHSCLNQVQQVSLLVF